MFVNPKSKGFTDIICDIYFTLDLYDSDVTFEMSLENPDLLGYAISEEFFRLSIGGNFIPKIIEYYQDF